MPNKRTKPKGSRSQRRREARGEATGVTPSRSALGLKLVIGAAALGLVAMAVSNWREQKATQEVTPPASQATKQDKSSTEDQYRTALAYNPTDDEAHYNLGLLLHKQRNLDEAVLHYRQALAVSHDNFDYRNNLAAALAAQGNVEEAIRHFQYALTLKPNNVRASFNLGNALFSQGQHEAAKKLFRQVIKLKPDHARAHNNLAVALKETGQLKEAYRHRHEAARLEREQQEPTP